jgi:hypothetical protein
MAFVTVEDPEPGEGGEFWKPTAIGDKLQGIFAGSSPSTGPYAKAGDKVFRLICKGPDGKWAAKLVDGPTKAQSRLKKAEKDGLLKVGRVVELLYKANIDTGKETPMKDIGVRVDNEDRPQALEVLKKFAAQTPAAPAASKPKPADDDLFGTSAPAGGAGDSDIPF